MKKINLACIIDDDPIFIFGTKKMLELADICTNFMVFKNGQDALKHLTALSKGDEPLPEVILLDLNMPLMDGWQFLDRFTAIPTKEKINIFIVSSSLDPKDIERAKTYEVVNNYIIKPIALDNIKEIADTI